MEAQIDSLASSKRESLIEHLFIAELMKHLWLKGEHRLEVLKPQVDDGGYDLVLEANGIIRHVQLKASYNGAKRAHVDISIRLAEKPSACVIWVFFDQSTLNLGPYLWFGNTPGQRIQEIDGLPISKHSKCNSDGEKTKRPGLRRVPKSMFEKIQKG